MAYQKYNLVYLKCQICIYLNALVYFSKMKTRPNSVQTSLNGSTTASQIDACSHVDRIHDVLKEELRLGSLRPGHVLDERGLAARFNVSRTPVRDALNQLAAKGLLRVLPRSGVVVPQLSAAELLSLLELLAELEAACAKFAARRMRSDEKLALNAASGACDAAAAADDPVAYEVANVGFHRIIHQASRSAHAVEQIHLLRTRLASYRSSLFDIGARMSKSTREHRQVHDAITAGDEMAAHKAMLEHISIGGRDFSEFVQALPEGSLRD